MQRSAGFVNYESVADSYLKQRQLKGNANTYLLWGFGICIVIGGDFFGWNYGLAEGGFWGMFIATALVAILYVCLIYSVSELSSAFPYAGGFYSYTRSAFGPFWGFVCGVAVIIEYILGAAATAVALSSYFKPLLPAFSPILIWFIAFVILTAINIRGVGFALNVALFLALASIMVLGIFYVCTVVGGTFQPELLFNIPAAPGQPQWLPKGLLGIFAAIPFAVWFFIGIEAIPLIAEETSDAPRSMPSAMTLGIFTLIIFALLTLVLNSGVGEGAIEVGKAAAPLGYGLEAYFSTDNTINIALLTGVLATFHGMMFAAGRAIYALSRSGYLPSWFSVTGQGYTPYRALIVSSIIGFICVVLTDIGSDTVDAVILNLAVSAGLFSYILVMLSYVALKLTRPDLPRSYNSPLGLWGGIVGVVLAVTSLVACALVPAYQLGLVVLAITLGAAVVWFLLVSRQHLVAQAPEEATALRLERRPSESI